MRLFRGVWCVLRLLLLPRSQLALENLALRQQLAILQNGAPAKTATMPPVRPENLVGRLDRRKKSR